LKNFAILLCIILTLSSFGIAYWSSLKARKHQKALIEERFQRMSAEELLVVAEAKLESLSNDLTRAENKILMVEAKQTQAEGVIDSLKSRLAVSQQQIQELEKTLSSVRFAVSEP
jgi:peptidoglycan hydrolase CwlO-like protein